jgi:hypothetical protein
MSDRYRLNRRVNAGEPLFIADGDAHTGWSPEMLQSRGNARAGVFDMARDPMIRQRSTTLQPEYRPAAFALERLAARQIPTEFVELILQRFIDYWVSSGEARKNWDYLFLREVENRYRQSLRRPCSPVPADYAPRPETLEHLSRYKGITEAFALAQVPDFIFYWTQRGDSADNWDARFINHVAYCWKRARCEGNPRTPIATEFQPTRETLARLESEGVTAAFALAQRPEFISYWLERGDHLNTWQARFISHVKYHWQAEQKEHERARRQKPHKSLEERLNDTGRHSRIRLRKPDWD